MAFAVDVASLYFCIISNRLTHWSITSIYTGPIHRKLKWKVFDAKTRASVVVVWVSSLQEINVIYFIRFLWFEATSQETTVTPLRKRKLFSHFNSTATRNLFLTCYFLFPFLSIFFLLLSSFFTSSPFPTRFLFIQETTISCDIFSFAVHSWIPNLLPQTDKNVFII